MRVNWLEMSWARFARDRGAASNSRPPPKPPPLAPLSEGPIVTKPNDPKGDPDSARPRSPKCRRRDLPEVRPYSRGSQELALTIARDPARLAEARESLIGNVYAKSAQAPVESKRETWAKFARETGHSDPFDLSADLVFDVMSVLREAGYRSADAYLATAKTVFYERNGCMDSSTTLACRQASRACRRGLGPGKHTEALPLTRLQELPAGAEPWNPGGPCHPRRFLVIGSWWLLREIEAAGAQIAHFRDDGKLKTLKLPVSKADPTAIGDERSHTCTCEAAARAICPACSLCSQAAYARTRSPNDATAPLFPNSDGTVCSKEAVVETIRTAAKLLGLPLTADTGASLFTGHAMRATGAIHLASSGVDLWRIQLFGRWGSEAFKIYVKKAPLLAIGNIALEAAAGRGISEMMKELVARRAACPPSSGKDLPLVLAEEPNQDASLLAPLVLEDLDRVSPEQSVEENSSNSSTTTFITNTDKTGRMHWTASSTFSLAPFLWSTKCGWKFGCGTNFVRGSQAGKTKCPKCFGKRKDLFGGSGSESDLD